jgi:hypothetical protein
MSEEHADVVREGVAAFVAELMEAEVAQQIGAELHFSVTDPRAPFDCG